MIERCYHELIRFDTFLDRYNYLKIGGQVGEATFGFDRWINQTLYKSRKWRLARDQVIIRDNGCDLGVEGYDIYDQIVVHHMNPISLEDIEEEKEWVFDPEYLICVSKRTHNAIHFGDDSLLPKLPIVRTKNDTCPWKQGGQSNVEELPQYVQVKLPEGRTGNRRRS